MIPSWSSYGKVNDANTLRFDVSGYTFWYSYKTLVAFKAPNHPLVVHENIWGTTTGKHLNLIDGGRKQERIDASNFATMLKTLVPNFGD